MKRIMLLLFTVLLIPIYSHAISLDELLPAMAETPERFKVKRGPYYSMVIDKFLTKSYMTNNNSALTTTFIGYYIYLTGPGYIYKYKIKVVRQGAPNSTLDELAINGTVSCEALTVHAYTLDGTFLPEESKEAFEDIQREANMKSHQARKFCAFI